jgi:chromosome segregation protein
LTHRVAQFDKQNAEQQEAIDALQEKITASQQRIEAAQEANRLKQHELNEARANLEDEKAGIVSLLHRATKIQNQISSLGMQEENLIGHRDRLSGRADQLAEELEALLTDRDENTTRLDEIVELIDTEKTRLEEQVAAADDLSGSQKDLTEKLAAAKEQRSALDSRRGLLRELEESQTGVDEAVKAILARKASDPDTSDEPGEFDFVRGLLAEMISADVENAAIVEAALGPRLQSLIVDKLDDLHAQRELLTTLSGRVTFSCLDQTAPPRYDAADTLVNLPRVLDLVSFDPAMGSLMWKLLGRTVVVHDLAAARRHRRRLATGYRFVTRDGQVLEADGRVIAGPPSEAGAGLISRRSELAELDEKITELDQTIGQDQTHLAQLSDRAAHIERVQQELRQAIYEASTIKVELTSKSEQTDHAISRIEQEQPVISSEVQQIHNKLSETSVERESHKRDAAKLEQDQTESESRVQELDARIEEYKAAAETATEQLTAVRIEAGQLGEQLTSAQQQQRQTQIARDDAKRQAGQFEKQLEQYGERVDKLEKTIIETTDQIEGLGEAIEEAAETLTEFTEQLKTIDENFTALTQTVREHRKQVEQLEQSLHNTQITHREIEGRCEGVRERAAEQLALDITEAYESYEETEIDWPNVEKEIKELKGKVDRLGNVNIDAIDEQDELENREVTLRESLEDMDSARGELERLIEHLDNESRTRFQEAFEQIREHFAGSGGLFRKLFGGGRARQHRLARLGHRDHRQAPRQRTAIHPPAVGRRAHDGGRRPAAVDLPLQAQPVLHPRRSRRRPRRSQRRALQRSGAILPRRLALHLHHAPQAHHASDGPALRHHDAHPRRLQAGHGEVRRGRLRRPHLKGGDGEDRFVRAAGRRRNPGGPDPGDRRSDSGRQTHQR